MATGRGLQTLRYLVRTEDDARRQCVRAHELECTRGSSVRKEVLPRAQQDGIHDQHDFVDPI